MNITFARFYPSDWRSGCIGMSFAEEGLYIRVCAYIYETGQRIPLDDRRAAKLMGAHTNAYVAVKNQLAARKKIQHHADGWTVERAERERALATRAKANVDAARHPDDAKPANGGSEVESGAHNTLPVTGGVTPIVTRVVTPIVTHPVTGVVTGGVLAEKRNKFNGPLESQDSTVRKKESKSSASGEFGESIETPEGKRAGARRGERESNFGEPDPIIAAAVAEFNVSASALKFSVCEALNPKRAARLQRRLIEIGNGDQAKGLQRFRTALATIPRWPFLAGREPAGKGRSAPFRLDLERLLSTDSGLGDVLAKLLDLSVDPNAPGVAESNARAENLASGRRFKEIWAEAQAEEKTAQEARKRAAPDSPLSTW